MNKTKAIENKNTRKLWIDVFKFLAIILVVVGHSTGVFNNYIYQFHMAAFFAISGYCTDFYKTTKLELIWKRLYSLIFPLISIFFTGTLGMWMLHKLGYYNIFHLDSLPYVGIITTLKEFFFHSNNYVWWMGACWFIIILFYTILLHSIITKILNIRVKKDLIIYFLISCGIYLIGYSLLDSTGNSNLIRVCIGQFFFSLGVVFKCSNTCNESIDSKKCLLKYIVIFIATFIIITYLSKIPNITMDYPELRFNNLILNAISSINGIILLFSLSKIIDYILSTFKLKILTKSIVKIGSTTMAIMFFHFVFFKLTSYILFLFNKVEFSYLRNFVPNINNIGYKYLWLYILISILGSIVLWEVLSRIKFINILIGANKNFSNKVCKLIKNSKLLKKLNNLEIKTSEYANNFKINIKNKYKSMSKLEKVFYFLLLVLFINIGTLIIKQGIILNDEIIMNERRMHGWKYLLTQGINGELGQGRPLRVVAAFNVAITNLTSNIYLNRLIQVLILGLLFNYLYKFIQTIINKKTASIWLVLSLSCLPLLFEHGAPNAFNGITLLPFLELIISLYYWCKYITTNKKSYYAITVLFWIIALMGYEFIVTYTPVFVLIYMIMNYKKNSRLIINTIKKCLPHCLIGVVYIVLTFLLQKLVSVNYTGVSMDLTNFSGILNVLKILIISAFPGSFIFNSKYKYLISIYESNISNILLISLIPIIAIVVFLIVLILKDNKKQIEDKQKVDYKKAIIIISCLILYIFVPVLPNSLTSLYQEMVSFTFFNWLPVSSFVYMTFCILLAYILELILRKNNKLSLLLLMLFIIFIAVPVQYMNIVISNQNNTDYKRYKNIENLLKTDTINNLNYGLIESEDIFETRNLLAIHDSLWSNLATLNNKKIEFVKYIENSGKKTDIWLAYYDDEYFCISTEKEAAILSKKALLNFKILETFKNEHSIVEIGNYYIDNGYYVYSFVKNDSTWMASNERVFENYVGHPGSDKNTIIPISGVEFDFWMNKTSEFLIKTQDEGLIEIISYFPEFNEDKKYELKIYVDDELIEVSNLTDTYTKFKINVEKQKEHKVKIETDFVLENTTDIRELSWILSDINGY